MFNKCLYLRIRSHKGIKYQVCLKDGSKEEINTEKCRFCTFKEYKSNKKPKKKAKKRQKVSHETYMKVLKRDNYMCQICGTNQNLHLHHIRYRSERKDLIDEPTNLIMLCFKCHELVHSSKKKYQPMLLKMMEGKDEV